MARPPLLCEEGNFSHDALYVQSRDRQPEIYAECAFEFLTTADLLSYCRRLDVALSRLTGLP